MSAMGAMGEYLVNVAAQGVSRTLSIVAGIVVFVLVARLLGVQAFGQYSYIMGLVAIGVAVADLGTTGALSRGLATVGPGATSDYWSNYLALRAILVAVVTAVAIGTVIALDPSPVTFWPLMAAAVGMPFVASRFFDPVFQVFSKPWYTALASFIYAMFYVAGSLAALFLSLDPILFLIVAYIAANGIYIAVAFALSARLLVARLRLDWPVVRSILRIASPLGVAALFTVINSRADIFMLKHMGSEHLVGLYSASYKFVDLGAILAVTATAPLIPIFSRMGESDRDRLKLSARRIVTLIGVVGLPCAIVLPVFAPWLVTTVYGADYAAAAPPLGVFGWVMLLLFFGLLSSSLNVAVIVVRHAYWSGFLAAACNIGLNIWWIPTYGIMGAAWATLISEVILVGVSIVYTVRSLGAIFDARAWLLLVALNGILLLAVYLLDFPAPAIIAIVGLFGYGVACFVFKLAPVSVVHEFLVLRRARKNATSQLSPNSLTGNLE